jgi:hypothetical protein
VPRLRRFVPAVTLAATAVALVQATAACQRPVPHFSEANARAHVNRLAGDIGIRPAGSPANARAREYLLDQLRFQGFAVRVQEAEASRPEHGLTARVANIIAVLPGARAEAIGLVAHYDSRPDTPGAADDAFGVAVCLEVARLEAARADRQHTLMVLLTDAEENGLLGAAAIVDDPEVRSRLRAYVNVEATGSDGPVLLFEAGPGNGWLVRAWGRAAPHPRGGSYQYEVYRRLPNDTDFTMFRRAGYPGLNFAAVGDSYAYHTALDTPERLTSTALREAGRNVLATVEQLDRGTLTGRTPEQPVYFDVAGTYAVVLAPAAASVLAWGAVLLAVAAWCRTVRHLLRTSGAMGLVIAAAWTVIAVASVAAALVGATALLRSLREVYHPWYAHPDRLWVLLTLTTLLAGRLVAVGAGRLSPRVRPVRHQATVWTVTLPAWIAMTAVVQLLAPSAAYLWAIPLAAAASVVVVAPALEGSRARSLALVVAIVTWSLWLPDVREALRFAVPLLGRFPIVTPVFVYPLVFALAALVLAPPVLAAIAAWPHADPREARPFRRARPLLTLGLGAATALAFAAAYFADAYTAERPLRRSLQYVADHDAGLAAWEVGGNEPGTGVVAASGVPTGWTTDRRALLHHVPVLVLPHPFRLWAPADLVPPPLAVEGRIGATDDETIAVELVLTPLDPGHTLLVTLPSGIEPIDASLPGVVRADRWTAVYVAAPAAPLAVRAVLPAGARERLHDIRAGLLAAGVPGGSDAFGLPAWTAGAGTTWSGRSLHLVSPFPLAPPDALR